MRFNCGITGHSGVLGIELIKHYKDVNFIKFNGDIRNSSHIHKWIAKNNFEYLIHLAAVVPTTLVNQNPRNAYKTNFLGTKNLVDTIIKKRSVKWFFFASTSHVYNFSTKKISEKSKTKPISFYGKTKIKSEKYILKKLAQNKNIKYCIGRIFSFTHKNQKKSFLIPSIIKKAKSNKKIYKFKNTNHERDFLSTEDICNAIMLLLTKKKKGIFNIGSSKKISIIFLIKSIFKKFNKTYLIENERKKNLSLVADNTKLKKVVWKQKDIIKKIIKSLI